MEKAQGSKTPKPQNPKDRKKRKRFNKKTRNEMQSIFRSINRRKFQLFKIFKNGSLQIIRFD